jgi:adenylyl- and sulfurtransferase ThiI
LNKQDIERYARELGTFTLSTSPGVASCGIPTREPRTKARFGEVHSAESALNIQAMIARAIERAEILEM